MALTDLCRIAGLRARALQYAFQETFGVTPMGYLKIVRLTEARRLLRTGDPRTTTVSNVGARVGFWHVAQFAQDYRTLFGERPNETLRGNNT